ncbi:aldo/keto reductase [Paenibacillus sp. FSL R10-2734]|uniref:aldo/keto reductase n=1 Tax=Paenibacillus sp. FSL R10-2734 TaxID=2954691 RepID=UPI0030D7D227
MRNLKLSNGYEIPQMGIGVFMIKDHEECKQSVLNALKIGYRHIDTAQVYKNEKAVGEAIKESRIPREDIFLTTKLWPTNFGYDKAKKAIQNSLDALQVDYIDLMLLHRPYEDYIGAWKTMEEEVGEGKIRSIGISNFNISRVQKILDVAKIKPVVNQVECHPYEQQKELRTFLEKNDILMEAWYPLGHGNKKLLSNPVITELAKKYGKSNVQIILHWHIQIGNIVFPKSSNPEHIRSNFAIFDFELSKEDMAKIASIDKRKPYFNIPEWVQKIMLNFSS